MLAYTNEELANALQLVDETISKCEKMLLKFAANTAQHTLLKNRIKAMYISKSLLKGEDVLEHHTPKELKEALKPMASIISKCEKARLKHDESTYHYLNLSGIIKAMTIAKSLVETATP